jgi:pyruvate/2-oxoglutarate dehydrogenase complex dihydrolipoamide dehydrogenase (E3) component
MNQFDIVIIGGGQAGLPLAHALAKAGKTVALAERKNLGGSCVNFGCTPTKAAIASAKLAHQARRASEYGLRIPNVEVDFAGVLKRARRISLDSRHAQDKSFEDSQNPKLIRGHARLDGHSHGSFQVRINDQLFTAKQIVLNTGTRSSIPTIPGLTDVDTIHAGNWLEQSVLPTHLVIIGGGYIGLEMSQFYARMGSKVTVLHSGTRIVNREDEDVSQALQVLLEREGIAVHTSVNIKRTEVNSGGVRVSFDQDGATHELDASHVFVATGRVPNTDDLGLETVGVKLNNRGVVEVNDHLQTSVPGIYAAGDIRGGPQFTHTSWDDYRILENQIVGDGSKTTRRVLPYGIFTDPELGRIGMTEREAREQGYEIKVAKFEMNKNGKALEIGEPDGFIKLVVDSKTDRILGAAVLASEGAELVHTYVTLMNADAPFTVIRDAVFAHPTLQEGIQSATALIE